MTLETTINLHRHEDNKKNLAKIAGVMRSISLMEGAPITKALALELEGASEWLELYVGELIAEDVGRREGTERVFDNIIP